MTREVAYPARCASLPLPKRTSLNELQTTHGGVLGIVWRHDEEGGVTPDCGREDETARCQSTRPGLKRNLSSFPRCERLFISLQKPRLRRPQQWHCLCVLVRFTLSAANIPFRALCELEQRTDHLTDMSLLHEMSAFMPSKRHEWFVDLAM